jgi:arylsulfatase A
MERRDFIKKVGCSTAGVLSLASLSQFVSSCIPVVDQKWNIVFILADDMGWNQVNYHGFGFYETPNIDRIAQEGMHFLEAYAAAPVCSPTRASLMTGKNPARLHLTDYIPGSPYPYAKILNPKLPDIILEEGLPLKEKTLAELFKDHGYVTGHFGKWHLSKDKNYQPGRPGDPGSQGFDDVYTSVKPDFDDPPDDAHHAERITDRSLQFIEKNKERPFFCYTTHHVVHRPLIEKDDLIDKYKSKPFANDPVNNPIMGAMIERMDQGIGRILDKLDELKLTEKTIVIFYSDNGGFEQQQKQYPLRGGKAMVFEGGIKVPLCIRWPGVIKPGTICNTPVISDDFFPTFAELLGETQLPDDLDGISIMPLIKQSATIKRDILYWHYPHYHHLGFKPAGAIRQGDYKLIEWYEESLTGGKKMVSLFNIKNDPSEVYDLSEIMPELAQDLLQKLRAWRKKVGAQEMPVNPNYDPKKADWRFADRKGYVIVDGVVR